MDGSLLQMFADAARKSLEGRTIGPVRWCRPLLSVPMGPRRDGMHLVAVLESPGPFCFLSRNDPLDGVRASARFAGLAGAVVTTFEKIAGQRILRLAARSSGENDEEVRLDILLFGSAGRAELARQDGSVLQSVGGRLQAAKGAGEPTAAAPSDGPFYLVSSGRIGRLAPSRRDLPDATHRMGPFDDPVVACRAAGTEILALVRRGMVESRMRPIGRRIDSRRKLLNRLDVELARAADHEKWRKEAEILAAYQTTITPGSMFVELPDVHGGGEPVRIDLDPSLPVRMQIDKRFKKAGKLERSGQHTRRRIAQVRAEIDALSGDVAAVSAEEDFAAAMSQVDELERTHDWLRPRRKSGPAPRETPAGSPFRNFRLDDMWFVLVGRNNHENDELTFHASSPGDLWFHARHAAGSHVILKSRGNPGAPPAHIIEAAASIAAHFSKAKHDTLTPVIYTARKYVRKFRGAKPGQVLCEREKMVMVEPRLPDPSP